MEAVFNQTSISCFRQVYTGCTTKEETAETVVPDIQPDISSILSTDGSIFLRSKEMEEGRVLLNATIAVTVLYAPEGETGVRALRMNLPCSVTAEAPGTDRDCRPVAALRLTAIDARMLNPRKILVRAEVSADISCYQERELELPEDVTAEAESSLYVRRGSLALSPVTGVREKTFVLTDEYPISSSLPVPGELVREKVTLRTDDVKNVGNKLIFKGSADVSLVYLEQETSEPVEMSCTTPFSQILELDGVGEEAWSQVTLAVTGAYFELDSGQEVRTVRAEIHAVAQGVSAEAKTVAYVEDAYSNRFSLELHHLSLKETCIQRRMSVRETLRELLPSTQPITAVCCTTVRLGQPAADEGTIRCPLRAYALCRGDEGNFFELSGSFVLEAHVELEPGTQIQLLEASPVEAYAAPAGGGVELRIPVDFAFFVVAEETAEAVQAISWDEEAPISERELPSIVVRSVQEGVSLWVLAKEYHSTETLICQANGLEEGAVPSGILLIPKARPGA